MDPVTADSRRTALRDKLEETRGAMHRAASAAVLKGDPLAQQMEALAETIGALGAIYEASAETQIAIAKTLRTQAAAVADEAIARVHASGLGMIDELAPHLSAVVERSARARDTRLRLRTILGGTVALLVGAAALFGVAYTAGFAAGRTQGILAEHTIAAAMAAGPQATAWATLMADNDPVPAMAACRKAMSADAHGRRYCAMPIWLDPPAPPTGTNG